MMHSGSSTGHSDQLGGEYSATATQLLQLTLCHEAAITLNNFVVTKLLLRDRDILTASTTYRDVIYLIKKCMTPMTDTTGDDSHPMISPEEIHEIVHQAYQRAAVPSERYDSPGSREVLDGSLPDGNGNVWNDSCVQIQVISNCLPCSNVVTTGRFAPTAVATPIARVDSSRTNNVTSNTNLSRTSDLQMLPNTSNHSVVSASTVSTSNDSAPVTIEVHPSPVPNKVTAPIVVPPTPISSHVTTPTLTATTESAQLDDTADNRLTTMSVYPMTIDDFHTRCTHPELMENDEANDNDTRMVQHQQFVEYHAAIILYNFGIIHQCLGMMDNDTTMIDSDLNVDSESHGNPEVPSLTTTNEDTGNLHIYDDQYDGHNEDDWSNKRFIASYKILTNTLSWIHELVQPLLEDIMNESNEDVIHDSTENPVTIAVTPNDHYYMNKYLQVMVLINYHVLTIIDTLHFPDGSYEYHCRMMHEFLNLISYLEIFYPLANHNDSNNSTARGTASPAA